MKSTALFICAIVAFAAISRSAFAQDPPPRGDRPEARDNAPPPGGREGQRPGMPGQGQGRDGMGQPGDRNPGGFGGQMRGPGDQFPRGAGGPPIDTMRNYLEVVARYTQLAQDPSASGVAAVVTANEVLRNRGPEGAISFFTRTLEKTKNEAVQRAIRLQLIDLYRSTNQQDKAVEQLEYLIVNAPARGMEQPMRPGMDSPMRGNMDSPRPPQSDRRPDQPREDAPPAR
jgi:hypothetical protein